MPSIKNYGKQYSEIMLLSVSVSLSLFSNHVSIYICLALYFKIFFINNVISIELGPNQLYRGSPLHAVSVHANSQHAIFLETHFSTVYIKKNAVFFIEILLFFVNFKAI